MTLPRVTWIAIIGACAVTALILAVNGYTGYSLVTTAVGLAAAVNLVPERLTR